MLKTLSLIVLSQSGWGCGESPEHPDNDASTNCHDAGNCELGTPDWCEERTFVFCLEMLQFGCGFYGIEQRFSCVEMCEHVIEYPDEVGVFDYSHCGTESPGEEGTAECWCRHPTDGRMARGNLLCLWRGGDNCE